MVVYRIGKAKYAKDMSGEGAKLYGGRWNHKRIPCIYTSETRALAMLEYSVNVNIDDIPRALTITTFEISDDAIAFVKETDLPRNWRDLPAPSSTKDFGSRLLKTAKNPVIKVPSSIIPEEFNCILNPLHQDGSKFQIISVQDLVYDFRIKS